MLLESDAVSRGQGGPAESVLEGGARTIGGSGRRWESGPVGGEAEASWKRASRQEKGPGAGQRTEKILVPRNSQCRPIWGGGGSSFQGWVK